MDPFFILAIAIMTIIFIGIPIGLIWLINRFLKKKTSKRISLITTSILIIGFSYIVIRNFYPANNYYLHDYKENTEFELPNSAILVDKKGSDSIYSFGDYNIAYTIELSSKDFDLIQKHLQKKGFQESEMYLETSENDLLISKLQDARISKIMAKDYGFKNYEILFMDDNKTMICNSNQW